MKLFRILLLLVCFMPLLMAVTAAEAEYIRPDRSAEGLPPTDVDLVTREGTQRTVLVQIINLTPYEIVLKDTDKGGSMCAYTSAPGCPGSTASSISGDDQLAMMNTDRTAKSFMFAPVGIPRFIPKTPDQAFEPEKNPDGTPNPKYDPNYRNTVTRPYAMVLSWDDTKQYVQHSWLRWTVKQVEWCSLYNQLTKTCEAPPLYQDVDLGLWIDRVAPETIKTKSAYFPLASSIFFLTMHTLALAFEFERPLAWVEEALALAELGKGTAEFVMENGDKAEKDDGSKMYLASYVIPSPDSIGSYSACGPDFMVPAFTGDQTGTDAGDAVDAGWGTNLATVADTNLVVSTQLLRGLPAGYCPYNPLHPEDPVSSGAAKYDDCTLGRIPIFIIKVQRESDWSASVVACHLDPDCTNGNDLPTSGPSAGASASRASAPGSYPLNANLEKIRLFLLQAGAGKIAAALKRPDRRSVELALAAIFRQLPATDRQMIRGMMREAVMGGTPTKKERDLVHWIGAALEKRLK